MGIRQDEKWVLKVADLGCGSADVIINLCKSDKNLKGVGIDISNDALEEAKNVFKIMDCQK